MKAFRITVLIWALLPLVTGLVDVLVGPSAWQGIGANLSERDFVDPVLDSQVRFVGLIWFGYGALLCFCLQDLQKYARLLRAALMLVFMGGIARLLSVFLVGMPDSGAGQGFIIFALVIELVLMPALLWWQSKLT